MTDLRKIFALVRAAWLHVASYRLQIVVSLSGLVVAVFPVYFVANALQSTMGNVVQNQGGQYFGFVIVGMTTYAFISAAVGALHAALNSEIRSGGLEALLSTPTSLPVLAVGMMGQAFSVTLLRAAILLIAASFLGANFVFSSTVLALTILFVLVLAYVGLGLLAASMVLAFKTPGPLPTLILVLSAIFGGVYYPTQVIPSWLMYASYLMPLTYGLRAIRRAILEGAPLAALSSDLSILCVFAVVLLTASSLVFRAAVRYARHTGTFAHY